VLRDPTNRSLDALYNFSPSDSPEGEGSQHRCHTGVLLNIGLMLERRRKAILNQVTHVVESSVNLAGSPETRDDDVVVGQNLSLGVGLNTSVLYNRRRQ
jgi:hypothetical protein